MKARDWIQQLALQAHPEGGYYKETYRCKEILPAVNLPARFDKAHSFSTAIYYLLEAPDFSAFHRIKQDELWHFYQGSALSIHVITTTGEYQKLSLGNDPNRGQAFQQVVKAGNWFAATVDDPKGFALLGCTVAPSFEFADFELADCEALSTSFPQHRLIIEGLTR
jgi:predicted cupin superfamily sugar epimerase